jgi:hypothetical protein
MMIEVNELVEATNPEVHQILGIAHYDDPAQAARRMVSHVPHLRIGRRIRFSIPALKAWAAARLERQINLQDSKTSSQEELPTTA